MCIAVPFVGIFFFNQINCNLHYYHICTVMQYKNSGEMMVASEYMNLFLNCSELTTVYFYIGYRNLVRSVS